ncbi:hypothetical protein [Alysiella filiformis]|uniref:Uncharacterized protein n=1 Tax=Alysiella filiformis DSM 16848 TaxID=1120981 RepID=A0A286EL69_9NEIS|nr:hypothetical protein [Alysiella filiformis]QMT30980.1 hypothetical protein H3L97_09645 [Alysiella filiformis]UBQ56033.1 hypothetical protein JF568_10825 [Alysiella filiformis DSM 16848]SOD71661.1 hypothetical protein SAMN02746062_02164 [Alysiella filiformis DSM 16848]
MKKNELHNLIRQEIPQITYLETDSPEAAEGEFALWEVDDCTIMLDFADNKSDCHTIQAALQNVSRKITFLNDNKNAIIQTLHTEHPELSTENMRGVYVSFWIENATEVFCDLLVSSDDWAMQAAAFSLEDDNELIFNGLE